MNPIIDGVCGVAKAMISPVTDYFKRKQEMASKKQESNLRVMEAKTQGMESRLKTGQEADIAWENTSMNNSGWKDEYWTIVISIPAVLCFIPSMADIVASGFEALKSCPDWYKWALLISVGSSFGYRKITDLMALKKGN